jgi:hypothetical protein
LGNLIDNASPGRGDQAFLEYGHGTLSLFRKERQQSVAVIITEGSLIPEESNQALPHLPDLAQLASIKG